MRFCTLVLALVVAVSVANVTQAGFDLTWDGGDGMWFSDLPTSPSGNWNGGQNVKAVTGRENGTEGYKDTNGATDILISSGKVSFDGFTISEDLRVLQGDTMTITGGAVWEHKTLDADEVHPQFGPLFRWEETRWTEMEPSELNLDNGTFRRTGGTTFDPTDAGGGALFFGSWKGDDNFGDREDVNPKDGDTDGSDFLDWQRDAGSAGDLRKVRGTYGDNPNADDIDINITNGGALENEGQMIFGADGDWQLNIDITINNGTIVATGGIDASPGPIGGDIPGGDASIVIGLAHGFDAAFDTHVAINFTGPGSITTDEGAIRTIDLPMDANGDVTGFTVTDMTYEDLWDAGILQANGGNAGAFGDHFSVTGAWGDAVYTLTSNIVAPSAGIGAVPEPTSMMLAGLAVLSLAGVTRRRRA